MILDLVKMLSLVSRQTVLVCNRGNWRKIPTSASKVTSYLTTGLTVNPGVRGAVICNI